MRMIKDVTRRALAAFGYELRRSASKSVPFENFANLVTAYEQKLNESSQRIAPNQTRPELLARLMGTPPSEAYHIIHALLRCDAVPGDVCEFGVAQGETSALIANEIAHTSQKRLHLFDSFQGLSSPSAKDQLKDDISSLGGIGAYRGGMSCSEDMVRRRLRAIAFAEARYVIHKGFIEQVLVNDKTLPERVSFAYVDLDFYEPIKTALCFLDRVTSSGAVIVVDDYDFFSTGAKTAVDEFVKARSVTGAAYKCTVPNAIYGKCAILTKTTS